MQGIEGDGALLTPGQVATRVSKSRKTVYRWMQSGRIEAVDLSGGEVVPRWHVSERALEKFIAERSTH
jgi:excisionase family DNA binding protein